VDAEKTTVVVGGQAGSEGKGAITARLAQEQKYNWAVRVGGPNAGHTVIGPDGEKYALRQLPVAAVTDPEIGLVIAAGSEIDIEVLSSEIDLLQGRGYAVSSRLLIDQEATIVEDFHKEVENGISTGTTGKGIGAARADRALRRAKRVADLPDAMELHRVDTQEMLRSVQRAGHTILLEGTQGFLLGSHAGFYPHCTSGDCRAIDFLAAAGLPPTEAEIWTVLRTFPIRIAGESGPLPNETSWEEVGVEPEITTVTKKVRRVGEWNWEWAGKAVEVNRRAEEKPRIALTFADYWWPEIKGEDGPWKLSELSSRVWAKVQEIELRLDATVRMLGTGPATQILIEEEA